MKRIITILLAWVIALSLSACTGENAETESGGYTNPDLDTQDKSGVTAAASSDEVSDTASDSKEENKTMRLIIGDTAVNVEWESNESVEALKELCKNEPLVIQMSMYGGFEQVGSIGQSLPRHDVQTTTESGDIVLYSGNQIVVFYGSNSWAYTRLGHVTDKTASEMKELIGNGDVTVALSAE